MSKHLKRLAAPSVHGIPKKIHYWSVKASPGSHPIARSIPLIMVLRDILHYCDFADEGRKIIGSRKVQIDGKIVTNPKFPVGLMDVVSFPERKEHYRILLDIRGRLRLVKITKEEAAWKLIRIENKHIVPGKKVQLNFHDGRNMLFDNNQYSTGDVLKISVPDQKLLSHYALSEDAIAILVGGKHSGELATVKEYIIRRGTEPNIVLFKEGFSTVKENVFVVGKGTSEIKPPEVTVL